MKRLIFCSMLLAALPWPVLAATTLDPFRDNPAQLLQANVFDADTTKNTASFNKQYAWNKDIAASWQLDPSAPRILSTFPFDQQIVTLGQQISPMVTLFGGSPPYEIKWFLDGLPITVLAFNQTGDHVVTLKTKDAAGIKANKRIYVTVKKRLPTGNSQRYELPAIPYSLSMFPAVATTDSSVADDDLLVFMNRGNTPILNPRLVKTGSIDYTSVNTVIKSLAAKTGVYQPQQLMVESWKFFSNQITHFCSPGREGQFPWQPAWLLRSYGYACCSHSSRALAQFSGYLGIDARVVTTELHEYPEIDIGGGVFQILDTDLQARWWDTSGQPLMGTNITAGRSLLDVTEAVYEDNFGQQTLLSGAELNYFQDVYAKNINAYNYYFNPDADSRDGFALKPGEVVIYQPQSTFLPIVNNSEGESQTLSVGDMIYVAAYKPGDKETLGSSSTKVKDLTIQLPGPVVAFDVIFPSGFSGSNSLCIEDNNSCVAIGVDKPGGIRVTQQDLELFAIEGGLNLHFANELPMVSIIWHIQYNPAINPNILGISGLSYLDDSGGCVRAMRIMRGDEQATVSAGSFQCQDVPSEIKMQNYSFQRGESGASFIKEITGMGVETWGIYIYPDSAVYSVNLDIPVSGDGSYVAIKIDAFNAANDHIAWQVTNGEDVQNIAAIKLGKLYWLEIPPSAIGSDNQIHLHGEIASPVVSSGYALSSISVLEGPESATGLIRGLTAN